MAMSAAMKYALIELFSVPTQDVEDADKESPDSGMKANGSKVERLERDIPLSEAAAILLDDDKLITTDQAKKLHTRFKDELRPELKPKADEFLYNFLGSKLFLDQSGNPSAKAIPRDSFAAVGKQAMEFARTL